jgi:hypothetical protein
MSQVSSIAMGANNTFATCQENPQNFMGPALWPRDTLIYAAVNQTLPTPGQQHEHHEGVLGSHLDMLHESPDCMGIEHEKDNIYWVFDGAHGAIVRYDFQRDHGPGFDDHSDGIVRRYTDAKVTRVAGIPSHLVLDANTGMLYVADTGGRRVISLDIRSGHSAGALPKAEPSIAEHTEWTGADVKVLVSSGLQAPSGIALRNGVLFVSDNATNMIHAFDASTGAEKGKVQTPALSIMGIAINADGKLWYVDGVANKVVRLDP